MPKLIHYNKLPKGTHFAAWEQPELFVDRNARGVQIAALAYEGCVNSKGSKT